MIKFKPLVTIFEATGIFEAAETKNVLSLKQK
jgi:hypothetical protein